MAKGGYRGGMPMGGMNQMQMMKRAQKMQEEMLRIQDEMESRTFEAAAGGGVVKAEVNGQHELKKLVIDPEAVDPEDVEMLQDLIMVAVNEGIRQIEELANNEMGKLTGGLNIPGLL